LLSDNSEELNSSTQLANFPIGISIIIYKILAFSLLLLFIKL
jgi:hypothetical protein